MLHRPVRPEPYGERKNGNASHRPLVTLWAAALLLAGAMAFSMFIDVNGSAEEITATRAAPSGYSTLDDLVVRFPSHIAGTGPDYTVSRSLELGASVPIYISAGQRLLFEEGTYLNLSAPPIFDGALGSPVVLRPAPGATYWGGLGLQEADPTAHPLLRNVTIERAVTGIRSTGSDLVLENGRIGNCSRAGIDASKVSSPTARVVIRSTTMSNCTYYGAQLSDVREVLMDKVTTMSCGTGIRLYRTEAEVSDMFLLESGGLGLSLVASELSGSSVRATSSASDGVSTTYQLLVHSSKVGLDGGSLGRAKVCAMAVSGSTLALRDMDIGPAFTDGVQSNDSSVSFENVRISSCRESAVHSEGSTIDIIGSVLEDNGKGSGSFRYSSLYLRGSTVRSEATTIKGSGDAHIESVRSTVSVANSTLGPVPRTSIMLYGGSKMDIIDTAVPGIILFDDALSRARVIDLFAVSVRDFSTGSPVASATVDLLGPDKGYLGSYSTGADGTTQVLSAVISTNTSAGNTSGFPLNLAVSKTGYELTLMELNSPSSTVTVELYPPNAPPTLALLRPLNGTRAGPSLVVEGYLTDDLGIHKVQTRVGSGPWSTYPVTTHGETGYFLINISLTGVSPGQQSISVQAFDGVHASTVITRTVVWAGPSVHDTDGDGLLDLEEDRNGNGLVDDGETDPLDPDTDGDGLMDGLELDDSDGNTTDPLNPDTDGDFLLDGIEDRNSNGRVDEGETDPNNYDTDGDGASDKDDRYPLDPSRIDPKDEDGNNDAMLVLILAIVIVVIIGLTVYLVIVKTAGARMGRERYDGRPIARDQRPLQRSYGRRPSRGEVRERRPGPARRSHAPGGRDSGRHGG